ncbi:MAG: wax ester/triacylglycerol synthase family O-acyltransferase [Halieaceae bacterium]|jgi:diacylglycerol O-acyltransferase / wax synthase|nr:wax ester/triacylglycerol synthase family O-acyltransferase [Halieaceae bacterium]
MKQLGILDSAFINLEQANTPQHVGGLGIYDPSTADGGLVRFKQVIATFERRLNQHPSFRTRLVSVPGGLDRPYWIKDANFDVEFHLRHIALPEPGDWRQLCIQVARLHSRPLDMSRPLWEAYIVEGLDNIPNLPEGCFAVYTKMHHALVDGAGSASFMTLLHDLVATPQESTDQQPEPRLVDNEPTMTELLTNASVNGVKNALSVLGATIKNTRALGKYAIQVSRKEIAAPDFSTPKTILNKPVGPHRVFDAAEFPLAGFKEIKEAAGVKLNDVALTVIGGALQRYLESKNEAPDGSLGASMPLNMRTRRQTTDENNQVGAVFSSLHSDEKDPLARLTAVHSSTQEAKEVGEASPLVDVFKLAGAFSPLITQAAAGLWSRHNLSKYVPANTSTVVSNVAGPDFPLYFAGARMVDYYGLGVLTPGIGVFHLVFSYSGKLSLSVLADRDIMPDPEFYHDCLVSTYEELHAATVALHKPAKTTSSRKVSAKPKSGSKKRLTKTGTKPKAKTKTKRKSRSKTAPQPKVNSTSKASTESSRSPKARKSAKAKAPASKIVKIARTTAKKRSAGELASKSKSRAGRRRAFTAAPKLKVVADNT